MRTAVIGLAAGSILASFSAAAGPLPGGASSSMTAAALYQAAMTNLDRTTGVHLAYASTRPHSAHPSSSGSGDLGRDVGRLFFRASQTAPLPASAPPQSAEMLLIGNTAYMKANATFYTVTPLFVSQTGPNQVHTPRGITNVWVRFPKSDGGWFTYIAHVLTSVASVREGIQMSGPYTFGSVSKIDGVLARAVNGTNVVPADGYVPRQTSPETMWIRASGTPVPVKITFPGEVNTYVTLSHYGEKVLVTAPSPAIASSRFGPMERISFTQPPTTLPTVS
jgi:hypothetical protein